MEENLQEIGVKELGEFNTAHGEYVDLRIMVRRTRDVSKLNYAHEERRNKAMSLRDVLCEYDPENSSRVDESIADLESCHEDFLRELRGV